MGLSHVLALVLLATLLSVQSASRNPRATSALNEGRTQSQKKLFVIPEKWTWNGAKKVCADWGMSLVKITNEEEQKAVEQHLKTKGMSNEKFWLAGYDLLRDGKDGWVWSSSGSPESFTYTNWGEGEPNNYKENQRCLRMVPADNYTWDDCGCSHYLKPICEGN